jgi:hypothetical protein
MAYFNRYQYFLVNGEQTVVPYVTLPAKTTDKRTVYRTGKSRLDKLSQDFYGSPYFGWLIMVANPEFGTEEWDIPDGSLVVIPFPLISSLQDYKAAVNNHFLYYGR